MKSHPVVAILAAASSIHTIRWVNAIAEEHFAVHLITMHPTSLAHLMDTRIDLHRLPWSPPLGYVVNVLHVQGLLKRIRPQLLHAHYASGYGTLSRMSGFHPSLLSVWGSDVYEFPYRSKWRKRLLVRNLAAADHLASTSHVMKAQTERFISPGRPIRVTPFGVDCTVYLPLKTSASESVVTIGTVKTLESPYSIDILIQAFEVLTRRHPKTTMKLLIGGEGSLRGKLEHLVDNLGLRHRVEFSGRIPQEKVPEYLNRLQVYVCVSNRESFGVSVLEASACGIPVVVSDTPGLQEVVRHGETGLVVPVGDVSSTADAIEALVMDPRRAKDMGRSGRRYVMDHFGRETVSAIMVDLYRSILKERGNGHPRT